MRTIASGLWASLLTTLLIGAAVLVSPSANAVEVAPEHSAQECPVSNTVFEDGADCFRLVALTDGCPAGTTPDGGECRQPADLVAYDTECAPTFRNLDGTCIRFDASGIVEQCASGSLVGSTCEIEGLAPVATSAACPVSDSVFLDGSDCYRLVAQSEDCPEASVTNSDGLCRNSVELVPGSPACEAGFSNIEGSCIRFSAPSPEGFCADGVLQGGTLCVADRPMVAGPSTCPVSADVILDGEECFTFVERGALSCPAGTLDDPNSSDCRVPVTLIHDVVSGGAGKDELRGGNGADTLAGDGGADVLRGGKGDDLIAGGAGRDRLVGNGGTDICVGDGGADKAAGSCETKQA